MFFVGPIIKKNTFDIEIVTYSKLLKIHDFFLLLFFTSRQTGGDCMSLYVILDAVSVILPGPR